MKMIIKLIPLVALSACLSASPLDNPKVAQAHQEAGDSVCTDDTACARGKVCVAGVCVLGGTDRPVCGNKNPDDGEECDDGNEDDRDDCTNACRHAVCGDGITRTDIESENQGYEACDDGNLIDTDACTSACVAARCGDGLVRTDLAEGVPGFEACDDGNDGDDDACLSGCVEARCGDGVTRADLVQGEEGFEACDDGNQDETDVCTNTCEEARCGDGILGPGEGCDDGNDDPSDDCNACQPASCGDGVVQDGEQCDDGNDDETDACLVTCASASCGDGEQRVDIDAGEEGFEACDDGNADNTDGCVEGCVFAACGDGFLQDGVEECDDANTDPGDDCDSQCRIEACGNGRVDAGEECDDGNQVDRDDCRLSCRRNRLPTLVSVAITPPALTYGSSATCTPSGAQDEEDDQISYAFQWTVNGNELSTDQQITVTHAPGTVLVCLVRPNDYQCALSNNCAQWVPSSQVVVGHRCGDNHVHDGVEACDDGNQVQTDNCLNDCTSARCGDGVHRNDLAAGEPGYEACDDGNVDEADSCRNDCTLAACGDGIHRNDLAAGDPGFEACDDGNRDNADACTNGCAVGRCGDGILRVDMLEGEDGYEACDDGDQRAGDGCSPTCEVEAACRNGILEPGEDCDDGNDNNEDTCSNSCHWQPVGTRWIPAGEYTIGRANSGNASPAHTVRLTRPFSMMAHEVTKADFCEFDEGCNSDLSEPVAAVTWVQATQYANWLSEEKGLDPCYTYAGATVNFAGLDCTGYRLPTEAEWESAARSPNLADRYAGHDDHTEVAQFNCDIGGTTVGRLAPNGYGLFDMSGNVREWVFDSMGDYSNTDNVREDPLVNTGTHRVQRGGGCGDRPDVAGGDRPVWHREAGVQDNDYANNGFRLVISREGSCGNGRVDTGEECDDGNADTQDACTNTCETASCGDGIEREDLEDNEIGFEACDDGNSSNTDSCLTNCQDARCGDNHRWQGEEECDDGNTNDRDGCDRNCDIEESDSAMITAGDFHTCVVRDPDEDGSGHIWCWGENTHKQLAINDNAIHFRAPAERITSQEQPWEALGAGARFTHASHGAVVYTWGSSMVGASNGLGWGATEWQRSEFGAMPLNQRSWGTADVVEIAGGNAMSAFRTDSAVYVVGCAMHRDDQNNNACRPGLKWSTSGTTNRARSIQISVDGNTEHFAAVDLMIGDSYLCAKQEDNAVYCLGSNMPAVALGRYNFQGSSTWWRGEINVSQNNNNENWIDATVTGLAAGAKGLNCVNTNDRIQCIGFHNGNVQTRVLRSSNGQNEMVFNNPLRDLAVAESVGCFVDHGGCVQCFGSNHEGQRGNGYRDNCGPQGQDDCYFDRPTPISAFCRQNNPLGDGNITNVVVGATHACAATANGEDVWCWGKTDKGQAGSQAAGVSHCLCPVEVQFSTDENAPQQVCPQSCRSN